MHFISRVSAERSLLAREESPESTNALLTLAEVYGSVEVYHWRDGDDSWGDHWSLTVSAKGNEYAFHFKNHKYY